MSSLEAAADLEAPPGNGPTGRPSPGHIPSEARVTLDRLMGLADETELRASTLAWMSGTVLSRNPSPQKARSLLQIAAELRREAEQLATELAWID
jgi:hypothetical protein